MQASAEATTVNSPIYCGPPALGHPSSQSFALGLWAQALALREQRNFTWCLALLSC